METGLFIDINCSKRFRIVYRNNFTICEQNRTNRNQRVTLKLGEERFENIILSYESFQNTISERNTFQIESFQDDIFNNEIKIA